MIEMGKKYTSGGIDCRVICTDAHGDMPVVAIDKQGVIHRFHIDGRANSGFDTPDYDLIEYHEPDIRTIWVNVYEESVIPYANEGSAKARATSSALAIAQPVTFEVKRS